MKILQRRICDEDAAVQRRCGKIDAIADAYTGACRGRIAVNPNDGRVPTNLKSGRSQRMAKGARPIG
jgi:hypothetical protein